MIRTALIGTGRWGKKLVRTLSELTDVRWCCNERNDETLAEIKETYGINTTHDIDTILNDKTVDVVFIATPISTHYAIAKRCLEHGKHVFIEKPIAETTKQAEELAALAHAKGKKLFVGYVFVHSPIFQKLKEITEEENIQEITTSWIKTGTFKETIINNLVSHDIALLVDLLGEPASTTVCSQQTYIESTDVIHVELTWKTARATVYVNRASPTKQRYFIVKTDTNIYGWTEQTLRKYLVDEDRWDTIYLNEEEPLRREIQAVIASIQHNTPMLTDGAFGVTVTKILNNLSDQ